MLESLTLTNFRQFDEKTVVFGPGNTSLRGANEAGKSTLIEAFLYLLGGVKACRNNDFCRWGSKASSCKVEALMTLQSTQIRATRGKSGAEIYVPHNALAPTVVGQSEVTAWFAEQFGATLDVTKKMCFAGQKEIGGLLDDAAGKAVEFIEELSGLDIVEFFITQIQGTGKVGVTTALVERMTNDREQLNSQSGISYAESITACEGRIEPLEADATRLATAITNDQASQAADRALLRAATQHATRSEAAEKALVRAKTQVETAKTAEHAAEMALQAARSDELVEAELVVAQSQQTDADAVKAKVDARAKFDAWPAAEQEWDEGVPALQAFIATNRAASKEAQRLSGASRQREAVARSARTTSSACGLCGKDVSEFPEVKAKNAEQEAVIDFEVLEQARLATLLGDADESVAAGEALLNAPHFEYALSRPHLFEVDKQYVPFRVKWIGGKVGETLQDVTATITALKAERAARVVLERAVTSAASTLRSATAALDAAKVDLAALAQKEALESEDTLNARIADAETKLQDARIASSEINKTLGEQRGMLKALKESASTHAAMVTRLTEALAKTEADLALYDFNNKLIEDLRKARPVVANKLWSIVLLSVSTYLSKMRGEPSIVAREGKTFTVNGRPSSSYSGSALDLLALGIRIALVKVFVPGADMLVLDEPFAACDADRTLQCLAFAASAGFGQTIIVTHESGTEELFDNIVEV